MRCPVCHSGYSKVYRTMTVTKYRIRRYRTCQHCGKNFSTHEEVTYKPENDDNENKEDNDE